MKTKEEIKQWIVNNCVNELGNIDLSDLDFSDFDGNVFLDGMKVKKNLIQSNQEVGGFLEQKMSKRDYNPWAAKFTMESNEPVSHGHAEPNYPNDIEIEFGIDDVADYAAEHYGNGWSMADVISDFIDCLPNDVQAGIADCLRDDDDFKQWLIEHKDIWLPSSRYR